jgi:hypothetical protein
VITFPAVESTNSIVVDTNVVMNVLNSDPTDSSLHLFAVNGSTTYMRVFRKRPLGHWQHSVALSA